MVVNGSIRLFVQYVLDKIAETLSGFDCIWTRYPFEKIRFFYNPCPHTETDLQIYKIHVTSLFSSAFWQPSSTLWVWTSYMETPTLLHSPPSGRFAGFVNSFLTVPLACLAGQQGSCITAVELSENILQNVGNDLMADSELTVLREIYWLQVCPLTVTPSGQQKSVTASKCHTVALTM